MPVTVAGNSAFTDVILFYALETGSFVETTGGVKLPLRLTLDQHRQQRRLVCTQATASPFHPDMTATYIAGFRDMGIRLPTDPTPRSQVDGSKTPAACQKVEGEASEEPPSRQSLTQCNGQGERPSAYGDKAPSARNHLFHRSRDAMADGGKTFEPSLVIQFDCSERCCLLERMMARPGPVRALEDQQSTLVRRHLGQKSSTSVALRKIRNRPPGCCQSSLR
ncbi:MAG: hypothetical protein R3D67_02200 [Hyphomicrobiaceae bacterium]